MLPDNQMCNIRQHANHVQDRMVVHMTELEEEKKIKNPIENPLFFVHRKENTYVRTEYLDHTNWLDHLNKMN